ncbi:MAG: hypothetical protein O2967_23485 [Proteobacteria bacterium]|nr:hypothetical protein [Pseudomonadota bacterium]
MADKSELPPTDTVAPDPFDPESLRLSQDFAQLADVKPILATVPVRKPGRQDYVRINVDPDYQLTTAILQLKEEREDYIVAPDVRQELFGELVPVTLFTAINRQGVVFLWPCRIPDETGRSNSWHESALEAAELARESWVRISADMSLGAYRIYVANGQLPEPEWPTESFRDLLKIAFKSRYIDSHDHPVLKRLRGEA